MLAARVGKELDLAVYLYEAAQQNEKRKNLSIIREGEYEGFFKKIKLPEWAPDYGPAEHSVKSGKRNSIRRIRLVMIFDTI